MSKHSNLNLFETNDYRTYVQSWASVRGRGEFRRISLALRIHTTLISQVLSGKKSLTEEQASNLSSYMGLNNLESDYFLKLVQIERSGTENLKSTYKRHLKEIRLKAKEIINRVPEAKELSEQDKAVYYSSWQYSVVRLLTSIEKFQTVESISTELNLTLSKVQDILNFLTSRGLCYQSRGRYIRTEQNTHIEARSPLATRHHQNWRAKSIDLLEKMTPDDLSFTAPVSLSEADKDKVREILLKTISEIAEVVKNSPAEKVIYLGIDWIKI